MWNGSIFYGSIIQANSYAITVKLFCRLNNSELLVTNVYGPAQSAQKQGFCTCLMNLDTSAFKDWVLGGDFNLIRSPENRNKPSGDSAKMQLFNELISDLDLVEIPFSGRNYT